MRLFIGIVFKWTTLANNKTLKLLLKFSIYIDKAFIFFFLAIKGIYLVAFFNLFAFDFRKCFSEAECTWCEYTDQGQQIDTPCCRLKEDCYFGKTKSTNRDICSMYYI